MIPAMQLFKNTKLVGLLVISGVLFFGVVNQVSASTFAATLDVPGGGVVVGFPVELQWYVEGGPATCTIDQGVSESFAVTTNPQSGSFIVNPPESMEPFTITCTRGVDVISDSLVIIPDPIVTLEPNASTTLTADFGGLARADARWNSRFTNRCSDVTYVYDSNPNAENVAKSWQYNQVSDRNQTAGRFRVAIAESATFFITCENEAGGTAVTKSLRFTVEGPSELPDLEIRVDTPINETTTVSRDEVRRYGTARFKFEALGAHVCFDYQTYNLSEYPSTPTTPLPGFAREAEKVSRDVELRFGTSTVLTVRCNRPEIEIDGVTYPATSTTLVRTFILTEDTTSSPEVYGTANINTTPAEAELNIATARATFDANINASNVDYCELRAYRVSDGVKYTLSGWTREDSWDHRPNSDADQNLNVTYAFEVGTTTRLEATCINIFDRNFGTAVDAANSSVTTSAIVTVTEPTEGVSSPRAWLYGGPSLHLTADDIWDQQTNVSNMVKENVGVGLHRQHIQVGFDWDSNDIMIDTQGEITFEFSHPYGSGESSEYNIHMRHCDESDGEAVYTFSTEGSGLVGTYTSDKSYPGQGNNCGSNAEAVELMVEGVSLTDGDEITISCVASQGNLGVKAGEPCRFSDLYFGTGSGGQVVSKQEDINEPVNNMMWMSEGANRCSDLVFETSEGATGTWSNSTRPYGLTSHSAVAAETTYTINCERAVDGVAVDEQIEVVLSETAELPLAEETVSDVATYDVGECFDVTTDPPTLLTEGLVPFEHVAAPAGLHAISETDFVVQFTQCVPLVDLSVTPVFRNSDLSNDSITNNIDMADNVNGTYNLVVTPFIQNLAEVDLPANAMIQYEIILTGDDILPESRTGIFNDSLVRQTPEADVRLTDELFNGVTFGTYNVEVRFNDNPDPDYPDYPDSNFNNNVYSEAIILEVPEPHMTITMADGRVVMNNGQPDLQPPLVRAGHTTNLTWTVDVNYPMDCTLGGPGIGVQNLLLNNVGSNGTAPSSATISTPVTLQNTSEYTLSCTEPTPTATSPTGTSFIRLGVIEVVPDFQET